MNTELVQMRSFLLTGNFVGSATTKVEVDYGRLIRQKEEEIIMS